MSLRQGAIGFALVVAGWVAGVVTAQEAQSSRVYLARLDSERVAHAARLAQQRAATVQAVAAVKQAADEDARVYHERILGLRALLTAGGLSVPIERPTASEHHDVSSQIRFYQSNTRDKRR